MFLESIKDVAEQDTIFVRYAGCTTASTPTGRIIDDWNSNEPRRLTNFTKIVKNLFPGRLFQVHTV